MSASTKFLLFFLVIVLLGLVSLIASNTNNNFAQNLLKV